MTKEIQDLVKDFINGDQEAFAELVRRYKRKVYSLAYRMLGNHQDADEVTQEIFVRLYEQREKLKAIGFFTGFLLRIATNYTIDLLRKRRRRSVSFDDEEQMTAPLQLELAEETPGPDKEIEDNELGIMISRAIDRLPPKQRMTVILHDVEGFDKTEVAIAMGCPEATVRSNLHIARAKLRKWLAKKLK